jgi:L-cysteine S-thiosulfotransferase
MKKIAIPIFLVLTNCAVDQSSEPVDLSAGKELAFARNKGNCLACHEIENGDSPGNIGPPLADLPTRFKNKEELKKQIWDATVLNPETSMPPFGRNKILSESEIDHIVEYLWSISKPAD